MDEPKLKDYHLIHGESNHLLIINGRTTKEDFQLKMWISEGIFKHADELFDSIIDDYVKDIFPTCKSYAFKIKETNY